MVARLAEGVDVVRVVAIQAQALAFAGGIVEGIVAEDEAITRYTVISITRTLLTLVRTFSTCRFQISSRTLTPSRTRQILNNRGT